MSAHDDILIGVLRALDCRHHIVVRHRAYLKIVADVELQLHISALLRHTVDVVELVLVEDDVWHRWQRIEWDILANDISVVECCEGCCALLHEAQDACLYHLVVEQRSCVVVDVLLLAILTSVLTIPLRRLGVACDNLLTALVPELAVAERPASVVTVEQHPRPLELVLHAV